MTKFTPEFIASLQYELKEFVEFAKPKKGALSYYLLDALDEIERLQSQSALLDRFADYLRHHVAGHKCFDFPDAKALLAEWERLRNDG